MAKRKGECDVVKALRRTRTMLPRVSYALRRCANCYIHSQTHVRSIHHSAAPLLKCIQDQIKSTGPLTVPLFQSLCLSHPTLGYYSHQRNDGSDPFGIQGDFVTSPEVSQVFGELLAVWLITRWQAAGCPSKTRIVELGPGRGTLMSDMIRSFSRVASFAPTLKSIHLLENSELMKSLQLTKLVDEMKLPQNDCDVQWHNVIEDIPSASDEWTMIIAHEFFDALPIHILQNTAKGFREVLIDLNESSTSTPINASDPLRFVLARQPTLASSLLSTCTSSRLQNAPSTASTTSSGARLNAMSSIYSKYANVPVGSKVEISLASQALTEKLGQLIEPTKSAGGAGLVIDYGDDCWFSNSFRGFRKHKIVEPLSEPGNTDITANVDFNTLKILLSHQNSLVYGPITQHSFLTSLGIEIRIDMLTKSAKCADRQKAIVTAGERLVSLTGMGNEYKVMGFESFANHEVDSTSRTTKAFPF